MCVPKRPNGFSLVEILISIILVGLSITALVMASNAFTMANGAGADLSTAEFLIEQIRERTAMMSPEAIASLNNQEYTTPIDAHGTPLTDLAAFSQHVIVQKLDPLDLDEVLLVGDSPFLRVTVTIVQNNKEISSASWIRADY